MTAEVGTVILLNGAPRSGKSSLVRALQERLADPWINLGVDRYMPMIPERYQPGIGLRPGGERPDLEPLVAGLYEALFASIAAHSALGVNVVADLGLHDAYSRPLRIPQRCAQRLSEHPVLLVGVRCPLEAILARREATGYPAYAPDGSVLPAILRWQEAVHQPGLYDIEVDTSLESPEEAAARIEACLASGAFGGALRQLERAGV